MWTADLISKSDSSRSLIRVLPLCIYSSTIAPKTSTLPTWMQLKRSYCLVSCMLDFLVSWYWNGPSSYGLPVIKQRSLRINVLWQRFNWHLAGPERRSRKITEMSHFPFWACMKHSSGKPETLGQTAKSSGHLPPRRGAYQALCVTNYSSASAVHLFRNCCFQGGTIGDLVLVFL